MGWMAWSIWAVLVVISAVVGWTGSAAIQRQWRQQQQQQGDPMTALFGLQAWGSPDLSPPSTSAEALAEVAELEALWWRSGRRRR